MDDFKVPSMKSVIKITSSELQETRNKNFVESLKIAYEDILRNEEKVLRKIQNDLINKLDFGEDDTTSIAKKLISLDPESIAKETCELWLKYKDQSRIVEDLTSFINNLYKE